MITFAYKSPVIQQTNDVIDLNQEQTYEKRPKTELHWENKNIDKN